MCNPWKLILVLVGIFLAGGVTGSFATLRFGREWLSKRQGPDQWAPIHLKKLAEKLDLKPEQSEQILPIIRRNMDTLNRLRTDCQSETKTVFERMEREISDKLTPDQRTKYEKVIKEMRERAKKVLPEHKKRPPGAPAKPAGEPVPADKRPGV